MKNKLLLLLTFIVINIASVQAQVTIGSTAQPNAGALLDLNNTAATTTTYRGVLLPQVVLSSTAIFGLNTAGNAVAINGMLVYNTVTAGTGATAVIAGTYIWQGSAWNLVNVGAIAGDNLGNHTATKDLILADNILVGTADKITNGAIGVGITSTGGINIGDKPDSNIFIGAGAGFNNNYFIGYYGNKFADQNQFIGIQSGYYNHYGRKNQFSGYMSGFHNGGDQNLFTGYQSGYNNNYGSENVFSGYQSGYFNTDGGGNVFIGYNSGSKNTTGYSNTTIGTDATPATADLHNTTSIGYGAQAFENNTIKLGNQDIRIVYSAGNFTTYSDARLKYHVQQNVPGLAFINKLRPVTYRFDTQKLKNFDKTGIMETGFHESETAKIKTGFLAQEVEIAAQETSFDFDAINSPENNKDVYSLSYAQFVVPLVKAVQELNGEVEKLKAENANLKTIALTENSKAFTELTEKFAKMEKLLQSINK